MRKFIVLLLISISIFAVWGNSNDIVYEVAYEFPNFLYPVFGKDVITDSLEAKQIAELYITTRLQIDKCINYYLHLDVVEQDGTWIVNTQKFLSPFGIVSYTILLDRHSGIVKDFYQSKY